MFAVKRNNKILSRHKTRELAVKAMNRIMKKESKKQSEMNKKLGWAVGYTYCTGMYCVSKI